MAVNSIAYDGERGPKSPKDIEGKRVGVRAYTQTTGAWVRGILGEAYGVDVNGALVLHTQRGREHFVSGEVSLRPASARATAAPHG